MICIGQFWLLSTQIRLSFVASCLVPALQQTVDRTGVYQDVGLLKQLADRHHIAILLIHHLRKLHDDDPMNMISGSTGLSGAADSAFVLQKHSRLANVASLHCTGRDIPDRT